MPTNAIAEREITTARVPFRGPDAPTEQLLMACVHCGLCLPSCPTYRETGLEMFSPRGRLYLMKAVGEGRIGLESETFQEQMSACLNCRACEAACPSGVQYGAILEASRAQIEQAREQGSLPPAPLPVRVVRGAVFGMLFKNMPIFRMFSRVLWLYQRSGAQALARRLGILRLLGLHEAEQLLPPINTAFSVPRGQVFHAVEPTQHTVALITGCIMSTAFADVHAATIRVLRKNGCRVILPAEQGCCGALHAHGGDLDGARELARKNIAAFEELQVDAIVVNTAGCGSTLKEYGHLLHDDPIWAARAASFSAQVRDVSEYLASLDLNTSAMHPVNITVTYQEPCHLVHAQRVSSAPRALLRAIPGLTLREMPESAMCCGSAGIYNVTQPEMAARLGRRKVDNALSTDAAVIVTANPGCHLQLASELRKRDASTKVMHVVEVLNMAYREGPR